MKDCSSIWRNFITVLSFSLLFVGILQIDLDKEVPVHSVMVICYHDIALDPVNKWGRTPKELEKDFEEFASNGINVISLAEFLEGSPADGFNNGKWVVLTFDDATIGQFEFARPLLNKFKYTATFYVPTEAVHRNTAISSSYSGIMTWDDLKILQNDGFQVASHTHTHRSLSQLTDEQVKLEVKRSLKMLYDNLGIFSHDLCLPYGEYLPEHEQLLLDVGIRSIALTTTDHGSGESPLNKIRRYEVKSYTSQNEILDKIFGR